MNIWLHFNMTVLLVLGLFAVLATAHNITNLEVPSYGDPRGEVKLLCHYFSERGDPPLHSVKWYRDTYEIFRFTPGQQPPSRTFNTSNGREVVSGHCNVRNCYIYVKLPRQYNTVLSYTCEVSAEGPRFAVVKQTKNLTVAVTMQEDPSITGVPHSAQMGEDLLLNCSTGYVNPSASIMWYIDGKPEKGEPWMGATTEVSTPDFDGLRASWRPLRLRVSTPRTSVGIHCEASQATRPSFVRSRTVTLAVDRSPHLSMYTASGSIPNVKTSAMFLVTFASLQIFSKYSALSEV